MLPQPAIVAHRGASTEAPENTMAAFNRACELGVNAIESDVRATRDGELVLCHDESLLRLTGQAEKIADLNRSADETRMAIGYAPRAGVG
jgi:glycerophosphoryl diester phosphodiesterase